MRDESRWDFDWITHARELDVELTWKALAAGDLDDDELAAIFLGTALPMEAEK